MDSFRAVKLSKNIDPSVHIYYDIVREMNNLRKRLISV